MEVIDELELMRRNIDEFLLAYDSGNLLLGIELIKSLEEANSAHFNLCIATFYFSTDENLQDSAISFLERYAPRKVWEIQEKPSYGNLKHFQKIHPLFDLNLCEIWRIVVKYHAKSHLSGGKINFLFEDECIVPKEFHYTKISTLRLHFTQTINYHPSFEHIATQKDLAKIEVFANHPAQLPANLLALLGRNQLTFYNIILPSDHTNSLSEVSQIYWNFGKEIEIDASFFPNLKALHIKGTKLKKIHLGAAVDSLTDIEIDIKSEKKVDFPMELITCKKLRKIDIKNTKFKTIPKEFELLNHYTSVYLGMEK